MLFVVKTKDLYDSVILTKKRSDRIEKSNVTQTHPGWHFRPGQLYEDSVIFTAFGGIAICQQVPAYSYIIG